jgi:hypothetical protein
VKVTTWVVGGLTALGLHWAHRVGAGRDGACGMTGAFATAGGCGGEARVMKGKPRRTPVA